MYRTVYADSALWTILPLKMQKWIFYITFEGFLAIRKKIKINSFSAEERSRYWAIKYNVESLTFEEQQVIYIIYTRLVGKLTIGREIWKWLYINIGTFWLTSQWGGGGLTCLWVGTGGPPGRGRTATGRSTCWRRVWDCRSRLVGLENRLRFDIPTRVGLTD